MPTLSSIFVIIFALVPGIVADYIFHLRIGVDPTEKEWRSVLRIISFSVGGLVLYWLIATSLCLPQPTYIFPELLKKVDPSTVDSVLFLPFLGHLIGATIIGLIIPSCLGYLAEWFGNSPHPFAWDTFLRRHIPNHWVIVTLRSGEAYAGIVRLADTAAPSNKRDMILGEPAIYDENTGNYVSLAYQDLFITASSIYSIAVVYDPDLDTERRVLPGEPLFVQQGEVS